MFMRAYTANMFLARSESNASKNRLYRHDAMRKATQGITLEMPLDESTSTAILLNECHHNVSRLRNLWSRDKIIIIIISNTSIYFTMAFE